MSVYGRLYCERCEDETIHYGPTASNMRCIRVHDETEAKCVKCHKIINLEEGRMYVSGSNFCLKCWDAERETIVQAIQSPEIRKILEPVRRLWMGRN